MEIRDAVATDLDWIMAQMEAFADFYGSELKLDSNKEYGRGYVTSLIDSQYVKIASDGPERLGIIAGFKSPHHFNPDITIFSELLWWVPAEHRNTKAGAALLNDFMEYGKANADWISFSLEDNTPIDDSFLLRRGFRLKEKAYLMEVR